MGNRNYKGLDVWNKSMSLAENIYRITERLPSEEKFSLTSQMRRASISIPSNIAEGSKRGNPKEYRYFVLTSLGSAAELETQLTLAKNLKLIEEDVAIDTLEKVDEVMKMLGGLEKSIHDMIK